MIATSAVRWAAMSVALTVSSLVIAQAPPVGNSADRAPTWEEMQHSQAWAATNLSRSTNHQSWVQLQVGSRTLKAWMVSPPLNLRMPVVVVLHEVFGLTDSTRNTADQIARMGYLVIAPDMLSGRAPNGGNTDAFETSRAASQTITSLPDEEVNADINAWATYGLKQPQAKSEFAVVGLSWGGGAAFRYASERRKELKAVLVFYDVGPPTLTQGPARDSHGTFPVETLRVPVFGFYPSKDTRVMSSLSATQQAMSAANKAYDSVVYEGAEHAYMRVGSDPANANPANATAVKASLERLQKTLSQVLP